jgi:phage FluMu protein Com
MSFKYICSKEDEDCPGCSVILEWDWDEEKERIRKSKKYVEKG